MKSKIAFNIFAFQILRRHKFRDNYTKRPIYFELCIFVEKEKYK